MRVKRSFILRLSDNIDEEKYDLFPVEKTVDAIKGILSDYLTDDGLVEVEYIPEEENTNESEV